MKIGIIGGGASGIVASIMAKNENNEVTILEKNNMVLKKLLATGNGKCNYWNENQSLGHYESSDSFYIPMIINDDTKKDVMSFFDKLGIIPRIKEGYYYPFSNQASTMKDALYNEAIKKNVVIKNNCEVIDIIKNNNIFEVRALDEKLYFDKIILSTGSKAFSSLGSSSFGYDVLSSFGHTIIKPLPALTSLEIEGDFMKNWAGIRTNAVVSLYIDNELEKQEEGELQLTNYGISGICVFNLANRVSLAINNKQFVNVKIDFLPFIKGDINEWFIKQTILTNKTIKELLCTILNNKLVEVLLKDSTIDISKRFDELSIIDKQEVIGLFTRFNVDIVRTKTFEEAQVCRGGVRLSEIDLNTMESKIVKGLYITGELLDLTGECGGYNLGIAWRSGILAGRSVGNNND